MLFAFVLSPWHLLIVLLVVVVLFPGRLFGAAKGLGQMIRQIGQAKKSPDAE
jgi:Sec-independent protein translocase protein TatA